MNSDERIYAALNSIPDLAGFCYWVYIPEEFVESAKGRPSALINQTSREIVSTLSGLVTVRADYSVDIRGETSGKCKQYLDDMINNLRDHLSNYNLIAVARDVDLNQATMRVVVTIGA